MQRTAQFFKQLVDSILSLIKVILLSKSKSKLAVIKNDRALILANGPSLNEFLRDHQKDMSIFDLWAMNHFAETSFFSTLKPTNYALVDPMLWLPEVDKKYRAKRAKLIDALIQNCTWNMDLHIPHKAKKGVQFIQTFKAHKYIQLNYYNDTPINGFPGFRHFCFRQNWGMPRPNNVLVPSIFLCINKKYKEVLLTGVEHSWFKNIRVNEHNDVLVNEKHFYDEKTSKESTIHKLGKGSMTLSHLLQQYVNIFKSYEYLELYSRSKSVPIINLTSNSNIDAFQKRTFSDLKISA